VEEAARQVPSHSVILPSCRLLQVSRKEQHKGNVTHKI
jgi:hypothetical protein